MGTSYLAKDKVYAVCTYQLSSKPQKFANTRTEPSVFYKSTDYPLLNKDDRNLDKQFTCKSPWNLAGTLLAFGAGLIVGALLLSNPVGWVILGAACVAAGVVATVVAVTHKCTDPLNGGNWKMLHNSVKINGAVSITRSSVLVCGTGGVLTPFFSYAAACKAAEDIASNNRWELGLNVVASFGAGFFLPGAFASIGTATTVGGKFLAGRIIAGKFGAGYVAFGTLNWVEKGAIRGANENLTGLRDNEHYERINDADPNKYEVLPTPGKPDDLFQDSGDLADIKPDANGKYSIDALSKITGGVNSGRLIITDISLSAKFSQLAGLTKQQLRTSPVAVQLLNDLNAGKYPNLKSNMTVYNPNRMNPTMVKEGRTANAQSFKNNASNVAQGILFLLPFVATWFSENTRAAMAESLAMDMSNAGLHVVAATPID